MGPELRGVQLGDRPVAVGTCESGSVRKRTQSQTRDIRITLPGQVLGVDLFIACGRAGSCVPIPRRAFFQGNQQNAVGSPVQDFVDPVLVARQVDPGSELPSVSVRPSVFSHAGPSTSAAQGPRAFGSASVKPAVVVSREDRMRQMGFSDKVISRLNNACATSTRKHYKY